MIIKQYKFKLEALLRMRTFREKKVKQELGEIVSNIATFKEKREIVDKEIIHYYTSQERTIRSGISAKDLSFYPKLFDFKRCEAKNIQENLHMLNEKYKEKAKELKSAMKEVKVIENMKEKDRELFRKERNKKSQSNIEELSQFRILRRD